MKALLVSRSGQKLALCATPRNHVRAPWKNVACDRHHEFSLSPLSGCFKINLGGVPGWGRILGQEPAIQPWAGGNQSRVIPWEKLPISPNDW